MIQILVNEVTQNYLGDDTHPTYIDRRIARELFIILEKHFSGGMDMAEGQTLCDSDGTSDTLSEDNNCSVVQFIIWQPVPVPVNHHLPK